MGYPSNLNTTPEANQLHNYLYIDGFTIVHVGYILQLRYSKRKSRKWRPNLYPTSNMCITWRRWNSNCDLEQTIITLGWRIRSDPVTIYSPYCLSLRSCKHRGCCGRKPATDWSVIEVLLNSQVMDTFSDIVSCRKRPRQASHSIHLTQFYHSHSSRYRTCKDCHYICVTG